MLHLKIGEIARQADVGVETIRYYERQGLLAPPLRRPSGYRQYDDTVVARLSLIRRLKDLGFTLAEIKELLGLWFDTTTRCLHVRQRAEHKLADIQTKIASLRQMSRSLQRIIRQCERRDSLADCPLWTGPDENVRPGPARAPTSKHARKR